MKVKLPKVTEKVERGILQALLYVGTAGFIASTWISDTPSSAIRNTMFAVLAIALISALTTVNERLQTQRVRDRVTAQRDLDDLLAHSRDTIGRINGVEDVTR